MNNVMKVEEVAQYLKVRPLYKLLKAHKIPAFRIGSDWRFNREHIDAWMADLQKQK